MSLSVRMLARIAPAQRQLRAQVFTPPVHAIARAVGAELRRMRLAAGMTHEQVALAIDSYRPIVGRIERGRHLPTLATCALYAAVTGGSLPAALRAVDRACGFADAPRRRRASARAGRRLNPMELSA